MKNNIKNIVVSACFLLILFGLMLANFITPDKELSYSERRKLATAPAYSTERLFTGDLFEDFEDYTLDQFVFRNFFRKIKAFSSYNLFRQKDNNDIYIIDGSIYKMEYPLKEQSVRNAAKKFNEVYEKYLKGMDAYYAIIPDKNYFVAAQNGYLAIDYDKMIKIMQDNVKNMKYINLFDSLKASDYYNTDIHWNQDRIFQAADKLLREMGYTDDKTLPSSIKYTKKRLYPFYGSYYGQAALTVKPDTLTYLTNDTIENAVVYDHQYKTESKIYMTDKFGTIDSYDLFLSGARPLLTITNMAVQNGKELIIFRDSFGSSIAPLLLESYSKITLVDLRYIATRILGDYMEFNPDADVLFLYNVQLLNNSAMLK